MHFKSMSSSFGGGKLKHDVRQKWKSFVDDLIQTGYCKHVSDLVLQTAEIQPLFCDL